MQKGLILTNPLNIFYTVKGQAKIEQSCTEPYFRALCVKVWLGYELAIPCLTKEALFSVKSLTLLTARALHGPFSHVMCLFRHTLAELVVGIPSYSVQCHYGSPFSVG